jgi:hypothetical protein
MADENPSIYQIICTKKRQGMRNIDSITDRQGKAYTDNKNILRTFATQLKENFGTTVKAHQIQRMGQQIHKRLPKEANTDLEAQVEMEEIKEALRKGKRRKAPGSDGIVHEFYTTHWDTIKQELLEIVQSMYNEGNILAQQKNMG